MSTSDSCKDGASKSNDDGVCVMLQNLSTVDREVNDTSVCANCGKEGDNINNVCNKCNMVKYCNAACKKKHRHKHKKECEEHCRKAAEDAAKLHDEKLFKQPPPPWEDCPICFIKMPLKMKGHKYKACCGKMICSGCNYAPVYDDRGNKVDNKKCPFCRTPHHTSNEEMVKRTKKRMQAHDPIAIQNLGVYYRDGIRGFPQNHLKALELWHRAAELGYALAYNSIGYAYEHGTRGVEVDKKKATHYYELAAMGGDTLARHNLGIMEQKAGNIGRAVRHYMIAAGGGYSDSLKEIKELYSYGYATKEDYTKALQAYQAYLGEIRSRQRDEAAAADENNRYY